MKAKKIISNVIETKSLKWKTLKFIQTGDFKELTQESFDKLTKSIKRNGFICPFFVWEDVKNDVTWCLDGFHRKLVMDELDREGIAPDLLPATFINCKDLKHATELVLTFSSIFARITMDGLYGYLHNNELDPLDGLLDSLDIPGINLEDFKEFYLDPNPEAGADKTPESLEVKESKFRPGEIIRCGVHKIIVGPSDCWQIDKIVKSWERITGQKAETQDE